MRRRSRLFRLPCDISVRAKLVPKWAGCGTTVSDSISKLGASHGPERLARYGQKNEKTLGGKNDATIDKTGRRGLPN